MISLTSSAICSSTQAMFRASFLTGMIKLTAGAGADADRPLPLGAQVSDVLVGGSYGTPDSDLDGRVRQVRW